MRGRGQSDRDSKVSNYHPKVYSRDVAGFLADLGIGKAVFLGTSMGGLITMPSGAACRCGKCWSVPA